MKHDLGLRGAHFLQGKASGKSGVRGGKLTQWVGADRVIALLGQRNLVPHQTRALINSRGYSFRSSQFPGPTLSKPVLGPKSQPSLARSPCPAIEVTGPACWVTKCGERTHPNSFVAENLCFAHVLNSQPACCHPSASLTTHLAGDMKCRRRWDQTSVGSDQDTVQNGLIYWAGMPDSKFIALPPDCI